VQRLRGINASVIWIEPPAAVNTAARSVIASLGVPTVPATHTPLSGIHPKNYSPWAREVAATLAAA